MRTHFELKPELDELDSNEDVMEKLEMVEKVEKLEEVDVEFLEDNSELVEDADVSFAESVDVLSIKSETTTNKTRSKVERADKRERQKRNDQEQHKINEVCKMQCDVCDYRFQNWTDMKNHYLKEHNNPNGYLICTCCDLKFRKRFHIFDHIEYIANPEAFKCDVCSKTYDRRESLNNHQLTHQPERHTYKCDICGRGYVKKGLLAAHLRIAHVPDEAKNFPCPECGMRFVTHAIMKCHIKSRHEKAYSKVCEICAKVLGNKLDYERHKANNHGNVAARVQCKACKKWMQECSVNSHAQCCRERPDKMTYICDICQKECPSIRALQGHKRYVHVKERSFQCTICEKSFKRALNLKVN
jgi:Zinc finger, C2H2 type/C2H2-type zinc finger/Zinc-finger of C2H2 type